MKDYEVLIEVIDRVSTLEDFGQGLSKLIICDEDKFWVVTSTETDKRKIISDFVEDQFFYGFEMDKKTENFHPDISVDGFILHHEFVKKFWGKEWVKKNKHRYESLKGKNTHEIVGLSWRYHLKKMVLCENRIDYLRKFIDDGAKS